MANMSTVIFKELDARPKMKRMESLENAVLNEFPGVNVRSFSKMIDKFGVVPPREILDPAQV